MPIDEDVVVGVLLRSYSEFEHFYNEERLKKVGVLWWFKDPTLGESIEALSNIQSSAIYFKKFPTSREDAHVIAHEISHIIRAEENNLLQIKYSHPNYERLALALGSMLEDPIIDLSLKKTYNFDVSIQYKRAIEFVKSKDEQFGIEPTERIEQVRIAFILANEMLRWDSISDPDSLKIWLEYNNWYLSKYPNIYKLSSDIFAFVRSIGLDTIEKHKSIVTELVKQYKLNDIIVI